MLCAFDVVCFVVLTVCTFYRYLKSLIPEFNKSGNILLGKLRGLADGKTVVDMMNEMHRVALDVIAKVLLLLMPILTVFAMFVYIHILGV